MRSQNLIKSNESNDWKQQLAQLRPKITSKDEIVNLKELKRIPGFFLLKKAALDDHWSIFGNSNRYFKARNRLLSLVDKTPDLTIREKKKIILFIRNSNQSRKTEREELISIMHKIINTHDEIIKNQKDYRDISKKSIHELISYAKSFIGIPYLWGGKSSLGFDCSGFVQTVFKMTGINMPRDASQQILRENLYDINYCDAKTGDLLFFMEDNYVNHVAIYLGNQEIIHSSGSVKVENLADNDKLYNNMYKVMSIKKLFNE